MVIVLFDISIFFNARSSYEHGELHYSESTIIIAKSQANFNLGMGLLLVDLFVPRRGLEPPWIAPRGPKPRASTNFATPAVLLGILPLLEIILLK